MIVNLLLSQFFLCNTLAFITYRMTDRDGLRSACTASITSVDVLMFISNKNYIVHMTNEYLKEVISRYVQLINFLLRSEPIGSNSIRFIDSVGSVGCYRQIKCVN